MPTPQKSATRERKHRAALRAVGLRPIQIWVPDVRSPSFAAKARRQSLAVAKSAHGHKDQAFIDASTDAEAT